MRAQTLAVTLAGVLLGGLLPAEAQPRPGTSFEILATVLAPKAEPRAEIPRVAVTLDPHFQISVRVEAKLFPGEKPEGARYRFTIAVFEGHSYGVTKVVREPSAAPGRRAVLRLAVLGAGGEPLTDPAVEVLLRVWGGFKRIPIPAAGNEAAVPMDRAWICDDAWPDACGSRIHASIVVSAPGYATLDSSGFEWPLPVYFGDPQPEDRFWPAVVKFGAGPAARPLSLAAAAPAIARQGGRPPRRGASRDRLHGRLWRLRSLLR